MSKVLKFKNKEEQKKDFKKILTTVIVVIVIIIFLVCAVIYSKNKRFRNFMDAYLFRKNITEENTSVIDIDYDSDIHIIGHYKYIEILSGNTLKQYNTSGKLENEIKLKITKPVYNCNGRFMAIGEQDGDKVYLIEDKNIIWENNVDGNISQISVNKNGCVSIILKGTTYKSVIATYDENGKELFKTYLSNTNAIDTDISNNNKYLAFAELNTSGTTIQSCVKIVSIDKAQKKPAESIIYTYKGDINRVITKIKYQDRDKLVCMYDDGIDVIFAENNESIMQFESETKNGEIDLNEYVIKAKEKSSGLFSADTVLEIMNINSKKSIEYIAEGVAKRISCSGEIIAIDLGSEVEFINTSGWMIKRYKSIQEIKDVILSRDIAAIVYKDRIELINL